MADTTQVSQNTVDAAKHAYDAAYKAVYDKTNDHRLAAEKGAETLSEYFKGPGITTNLIGLGISFAATFASIVVDKVTQAKQAGQPGLHDLIASTLSDALLIDIKSSDIPIGQGAQGQAAVNAALGGKFLDALKTFMGANGAISGDSAEKAAAAILGLGMQMSVNTGFLAILGGAIPYLHMDELKEIGEMLEKSLGLGRLVRQFLAPYIQQLVQKPLTRQLASKYRQDILGTHELIKAIMRGGPLASQARTLLAQHGLPEDQINELTDQLRPHLSESELETLVYWGEIDQAAADAHIVSAGIPSQIAEKKFRALTVARLARLREAGMNEVLGFIAHGRLPVTAVETAFKDFDIPLLEQDLWRARANYFLTVRRRELSKADVIYLYENGQFTLDEVRKWAEEEGFDAHDAMAIELEVLQKTQDFQTRKDQATARSTTSAHARNVAFVTDQFLKIAVRTPTAAELQHWVDLLDKKQRTRADVTAELKLQFES